MPGFALNVPNSSSISRRCCSNILITRQPKLSCRKVLHAAATCSHCAKLQNLHIKSTLFIQALSKKKILHQAQLGSAEVHSAFILENREMSAIIPTRLLWFGIGLSASLNTNRLLLGKILCKAPNFMKKKKWGTLKYLYRPRCYFCKSGSFKTRCS